MIKCVDCKYWDPYWKDYSSSKTAIGSKPEHFDAHMTGEGICRKYGPTMLFQQAASREVKHWMAPGGVIQDSVNPKVLTVWPTTNENDWCGAFENREAIRPKQPLP